MIHDKTRHANVSFRLGSGLVLALALLTGAVCGEDGARIVFYSERDGNAEIYIMNADGGNARRLTNDGARDYDADAGPDGETLVFSSQATDGENAPLYLMTVDGAAIRPLTSPPEQGAARDEYPDWSPDGTRIVFQRVTIPLEGNPDSDIWLAEVATGRETRLTQAAAEWDSTPSFEKGGRSVLFESNRGNFDLYRLDLETMEITQLTDEETNDLEAEASPDGTRIAFASERDGDYEIYVMDRDGGNVRRLTDNDAQDRCPQWSPDGERMLFYSERDGDREIYVMNADGSGQRRLTDSPGVDDVASWLVAR